MVFCNIKDINLEILSWTSSLKLFVSSSILDKKSYVLVTDSPIYGELNILKNYCEELNKNCAIDIYYELDMYHKLGLINILQKLKKNNRHFISDSGINHASCGGHVNILKWSYRCIRVVRIMLKALFSGQGSKIQVLNLSILTMQ